MIGLRGRIRKRSRVIRDSFLDRVRRIANSLLHVAAKIGEYCNQSDCNEPKQCQKSSKTKTTRFAPIAFATAEVFVFCFAMTCFAHTLFFAITAFRMTYFRMTCFNMTMCFLTTCCFMTKCFTMVLPSGATCGNSGHLTFDSRIGPRPRIYRFVSRIRVFTLSSRRVWIPSFFRFGVFHNFCLSKKSTAPAYLVSGRAAMTKAALSARMPLIGSQH